MALAHVSRSILPPLLPFQFALVAATMGCLRWSLQAARSFIPPSHPWLSFKCKKQEEGFRTFRGSSVHATARTLMCIKTLLTLGYLIWDLIWPPADTYRSWFVCFSAATFIIALAAATLTFLSKKVKGYRTLLPGLWAFIILFDTLKLLLQQIFRVKPAPQVEGYLLVLFYLGPMCRAILWPQVVFLNLLIGGAAIAVLPYREHPCSEVLNFVALYVVNIGISLVLAYLLEQMERQAFGLHLHLETELTYRKACEDNAVKERDNSSAFLARMSHEIRTPLNGILGVMDLLLSLKSEQLGPEQLRLVQSMKGASDHLIRIVNDILDLAKIGAGKLSLTRQDIKFSELPGVCLQMFACQVKEKQLQCNMDVSPSIPKVVVGDETRMIQILSNLLSNSVKFTPSLGTINIKVEVSPEPRAVAPDCIWLSFEVSDSGRGMTSSQQELLFTAYYQTESGIDREHQGTGLGLSIVKKLIDLMGGTLGVQSNAGRGTRFVFSIPFGLKEPALAGVESELVSPVALGWHSLTFLIVDDTPLNLVVLQKRLEQNGSRVLSACNGEDAIRVYTSNCGAVGIDVILMDIWMPVLDGLQATKRLREKGATQPIIGLTADYTSAIATQAIESGMTKVLLKPIKWGQFEQELCPLVVTQLEVHDM